MAKNSKGWTFSIGFKKSSDPDDPEPESPGKIPRWGKFALVGAISLITAIFGRAFGEVLLGVLGY